MHLFLLVSVLPNVSQWLLLSLSHTYCSARIINIISIWIHLSLIIHVSPRPKRGRMAYLTCYDIYWRVFLNSATSNEFVFKSEVFSRIFIFFPELILHLIMKIWSNWRHCEQQQNTATLDRIPLTAVQPPVGQGLDAFMITILVHYWYKTRWTVNRKLR